MRILTTREFFEGRHARVAIYREPHQESMRQHRHDFLEIVIVISGSGIHAAGSFQHRIEVGDVLVLDRRRTHGYRDTHDLNLINILVRQDILTQIGRKLGNQPGYCSLFGREPGRPPTRDYTKRVQLPPADIEMIEGWVARLEEDARPSPQATRLLQEAYLALIIDALCLKRSPGRPATPTRRAPSRSSKSGLERALSWIEKNFDRVTSVADMAAQAGMSKRTFQRAFAASIKITPQAYVVETRVRHAAEQIVQATQREEVVSFTELALACGFSDSNYFSRCFRRLMRMSPREYRHAALSGRRLALPRFRRMAGMDHPEAKPR